MAATPKKGTDRPALDFPAFDATRLAEGFFLRRTILGLKHFLHNGEGSCSMVRH
jgi:hypothetical protein